MQLSTDELNTIRLALLSQERDLLRRADEATTAEARKEYHREHRKVSDVYRRVSREYRLARDTEQTARIKDGGGQ